MLTPPGDGRGPRLGVHRLRSGSGLFEASQQLLGHQRRSDVDVEARVLANQVGKVLPEGTIIKVPKRLTTAVAVV